MIVGPWSRRSFGKAGMVICLQFNIWLCIGVRNFRLETCRLFLRWARKVARWRLLRPVLAMQNEERQFSTSAAQVVMPWTLIARDQNCGVCLAEKPETCQGSLI